MGRGKGWWLGLGLLLLAGCNEQVPILAPSEDFYVVYAVLDPSADAQAVRVSRVFQPPGDAYAFAQTVKQEVADLTITLTGEGQSWQAIFQDSVKRTGNGDFGEYTGTYFFRTDDSLRLVSGKHYVLTLTRENDPDFLITAQTTIPEPPVLISPALSPQPRFEDFCLPTFNLEDSARVFFFKNKRGTTSHAWGFEVLVRIAYDSAGVQLTEQFGPSKIFSQSAICSTGNPDLLCYELPKQGVIPTFIGRGWNPSGGYTYEREPLCGQFNELSRAVEVQVTAVDTALGKLFTASDPRYPNFNDYRKEFTNLSGTVPVIGIFGAIAYRNVSVTLSPCAEYKLGLNGASGPNPCPR